MSQTINTMLRRSHIQRLVEGIAMIGGDFERFGELFVEQLLGVPLNHRGLNVLGFPVGGNVDTHSPDGSWVAEYSAEAGYFSGDMPKAAKDLDHALAKQPNAREIVLLSAQKRVAVAEQKFLAGLMGRTDLEGRTVQIWSAEDIATKIIDHLLMDDRAAGLLSPYLPVFDQIRDEHAASLQMPTPEEGALDRPAVDQALETLLAERPVVVISGLGGAGKSQAAAAFAQAHRDNYQNQIWLKGADVPSIESLKAVAIARAGDARNVAYLLQSRPTLLVIDDIHPDLDRDAVAALCGSGSHVIATSRTDGGYRLPAFSTDEARQVVGQDIAEPCPDGVFNAIWAVVGGHPLTYGLINGAVRNGASWAEIRQDCQVIGELSDSTERLADRLLARVIGSLGRELALFRWIDKPDCDEAFARAAIRPVGLRKLREACLTTADRPGVVRLHDVVFASLQAITVGLPDETAAFTDNLATYIEKAATSGDGIAFWTVARSLDARLREATRLGDRRAAFIYALLEVNPPVSLDPGLLEEPETMAARLRSGDGPIAPIETMAVIETIETGYLYRKELEGKESAEKALASQLAVFDHLAAHPDLSTQQVSELTHHKGKALLRLRDQAGARTLFESVIDGPYPLHEARFQLLKILIGNRETPEGVSTIATTLLDGYFHWGDVTMSVFLATVEQLPRAEAGARDALLASWGDLIEEALIRLAELGIGQAYRTLAAIGRHWARTDRARFVRIFDAVPPREPDVADEDGDLFAYGELLLEAAHLKPDHAHDLRLRALATYKAVRVLKPGYQVERLAELLIDMDRPQEGIDLLEATPETASSAFGQYRLARAYSAVERMTEAAAAIQTGLTLLNKPQYRQTFEALAAAIAGSITTPET